MAIRPNTHVLVEGTIDFSRIFSRVEGEELAERLAKFGQGTQKPHTFVDLSDITVVPSSGIPGDFNDEEAFVYHSKGFDRPKHPEKKRCLHAENLSASLPQVLVRSEDGKHTPVTNLTGDLASGTRVRVVVRTYHVKSRNLDAISLEAILLDTPTVPYRAGNRLTSDSLAAFGIVIADAPVAAPQEQAPQAPQANTAAAPAAPVAQEAPVTAPVDNSIPPAPQPASPSIPSTPKASPFGGDEQPAWGTTQGINAPS